jgi:hypothetical protein
MIRFPILFLICFVLLKNSNAETLIMGEKGSNNFRLIGCGQNDSSFLFEDKALHRYIAQTHETFNADGFQVTVLSSAYIASISGSKKKVVDVEFTQNIMVARDSSRITFICIKDITDFSGTASSDQGVQLWNIIDDKIVLTLNSSDATFDTIGLFETAVVRDYVHSYRFIYLKRMNFNDYYGRLLTTIQIQDLGYQKTQIIRNDNQLRKSYFTSSEKDMLFQLNGRAITKTQAIFPYIQFIHSKKSIVTRFQKHGENRKNLNLK